METTANQSLEDLRTSWQKLLEEQPKTRIRNAAEALGVSEGQLLATKIGETVTRLNIDQWQDLFKDIQKLGKVMALTRNNDVVHERKGVYNNVSFNPMHGLVLDPDIDLRLFPSCWTHVFSVTEPFKDDFKRSFQFFDEYGTALHKIYLTPDSDVAVFEQLTEQYKSADQQGGISVKQEPLPEPIFAGKDETDVAAFQQEWLALQDTHDFFGLVRKYRLHRVTALELAPQGHAVKVGNDSLRKVLQAAAVGEVPIMVFVGNRGCIQIHTGAVKKLFEYENWYNVMDPDFNLHVKEDAIVQSWIVQKPTDKGIVTSLELFSESGELIVTLFGKRKPDIPEDEGWRLVVEQATGVPTVE